MASGSAPNTTNFCSFYVIVFFVLVFSYKSNKKVFVTDWVPTLLHAAGMAEEEINALGLDGVDQYDTLFNNGPEARSNFIYNIWADANGNNVGAIRSGPFKLLNFDSSMQYQDNFELYNLEEDPTESTDLAPDNASLVDELKIMFNVRTKWED